MEWAKKREWMVIGVLGAVLLAVVLILSFAVFYKTPTCTDGKKDGDETGIDCGGSSCSTVCTVAAQRAEIRFARTLSQSGRSDLIAYIVNPNPDVYAKDARFTIDVYRQDGHVLKRHAVLTLPPNTSTPLFIPGISSEPVQQIFVSFDAGSPVWTRAAQQVVSPKASNIVVEGTDAHPRITATITNQTAYPGNNVPLVATVFAEDGTAIAASQTILPKLPAQGSAQAVFTWNEPFSAAYARIDVVPLTALPMLLP